MTRIIQVVPVFARGDAIGNESVVLEGLLCDRGFETEIWTCATNEKSGMRIAGENDFRSLSSDDVAILHLSTSHPVNVWFAMCPARKFVIYHNITPGSFFDKSNPMMAEVCRDGRAQMRYLADKVDYCIADSDYNKKELVDAGYTCPMATVPVVVALDDYKQQPDPALVEQLGAQTGTKVVFVGRVVPNKKHEDVIAAFGFYQEHFDPDAHLYLVGTYEGHEAYQNALQSFAEAKGIRNVNFTGKVPFRSILSYYHEADVFLCMSEHEGFCVPLLEAMSFDVPIVAFDSSAIAETLGGSGILLKRKDPAFVASVIHELMTNDRLKDQVVAGQRKRLERFNPDAVSRELLDNVCIGLGAK